MHEPLNMTEAVTSPDEPRSAELPQKASLGRVLRDQKKTLAVAVVMVVATYWIAGQFGEWELAGCIAGGVLLGLANQATVGNQLSEDAISPYWGVYIQDDWKLSRRLTMPEMSLKKDSYS